ncbi:MAG: TetR/AcrR family transcriptional regulator [Planctomycetaceae bacterium]|nr:MAG: TetR/AcrR family transcriptional regulator [Planctomycetaceae bacterium]
MMAKLAERRKELLDSMMKEAVYEGAVQVLTQYGLSGTTMDRVAAASGMAKGSLYNCFRNKQQLLEFVHDRAVTPLRLAIDQVVAGPLGAAEKLRVIIRMWREYLVEHQAVFEFLISDQTVKQRLRATEQTARDTGIRQVVTILRQGIDEGVFRSVDVQAVAEMMISAAIGLVEREFATGQRREVDEAVETMSSVFLYGFSAEHAS